jgi:UDP-N-acetylmuramate-alanine ligase
VVFQFILKTLITISKDFLEERWLLLHRLVPKTHSEWNYFLERFQRVKKRRRVLGIVPRYFLVAGTHGKTTTSGILGHILTRVEQMLPLLLVVLLSIIRI